MKRILLWLILISIVLAMLFSSFNIKLVKATATEQIVNGGFETGDWTAWVNAGGFQIQTIHVHSGSYSVGSAYTGATITQTLETLILTNDIINFTFWTKSPSAQTYFRMIVTYTDNSTSVESYMNPAPTYYQFSFTNWTSSKYLDYFTIVFDAYLSGTTFYVDDVSLMATESVIVTIVKPENTTYNVSGIPVEISASGGTIDQIWYNCKNDTSWIYGSNQTYTSETSMTDFANSNLYTFYAWANNTDGASDEETVMFTVATPIVVETPPFTLPMMFIFGIIGLCCMFAGPMYGIYKVKKEEYYGGFRIGLIVTCLGAALVVAWLWGGVPNL